MLKGLQLFTALHKVHLAININSNKVNCYRVTTNGNNVYDKLIVIGSEKSRFNFFNVIDNRIVGIDIRHINKVSDAGDIEFSHVNTNDMIVQTPDKKYMKSKAMYFINNLPLFFTDNNGRIYVFEESGRIYFGNYQLGFYHNKVNNLAYFVRFMYNQQEDAWYYNMLLHDGKVMMMHDNEDMCCFIKGDFITDSVPNKIDTVN